MPNLGEIKTGKELRKKGADRFIWAGCLDCGKERWVAYRKGEPVRKRCLSCSKSGENSPRWKGGRTQLKQGYIQVKLFANDPFYSMAVKHGKNVFEHRLIMARHLGRCLLSTEQVHHRNGIKNDNRLENLQLVSPANHVLYNQLCSNCELRKEIRLLRWQVKELTSTLQEKLNV